MAPGVPIVPQKLNTRSVNDLPEPDTRCSLEECPLN